MANKARKYCAAFPCRNFAEDGAYCHRHRPPPAPKETNPFYLSVRWRRFRAWYLCNHPLCECCLIENRGPVAAKMVDHRVEISDGGALTTEENAQALCWKCHAVKTAAEQNKRKNHQQSSADNRIGTTGETF